MTTVAIICLALAGVCLGSMCGLAFSENFEWKYQKIQVILSYVVPIIVYTLTFLLPVFFGLV